MPHRPLDLITYWPQIIGKGEAAVKVATSLLKKSPEFTRFQLALLDYRNTPPLGHSFSPAQRSMAGAPHQTTTSSSSCFRLMPLSDTSAVVQGEIQMRRQRAAVAYNNHHQVQSPLPDLEVGDNVYVKPPPHRRGHAWSYGRIIHLVEPHSCVVDTSSGEVRRNRAQVRMAAPPPPAFVQPSPPYAPAVVSRSRLPSPASTASNFGKQSLLVSLLHYRRPRRVRWRFRANTFDSLPPLKKSISSKRLEETFQNLSVCCAKANGH